jgi:hypothetical protein
MGMTGREKKAGSSRMASDEREREEEEGGAC